MRKTLKVVAFGGGPADAFIKAAGITDSTQQTAIKTLVNDLNGYGLWSKMKAIYPMVGGTATSHSYNLKDTTKFQITFNGGWTHDSTGALPNGTNAYADTQLIGTVDILSTNAGMGIYSGTQAISAGAFGTGPNYHIFPRYTDNNTYYRLFNASGFSNNNGSSLGLIHGYSNGTNNYGYYNSSSVGSGAVNNSGDSSQNLWFARMAGNYDNHQLRLAFASLYLTSTEASNLYTAIQKFQTTLNRFVGTPIYTSFDSDAQSFMTSASITDSTQQAAVNYLVTDLKANSLWSKMKAVYPMVGGSATSHSYNLKNPSQFQITWNGGLTHDSNGVTGNGTNGYGNLNLNPRTHLSTQFSFGTYCRVNNGNPNQFDIGSTDQDGYNNYISISQFGSLNYNHFVPANGISVSNTTTNAFFHVGLDTSNNLFSFKNTTLLQSKTPASIGTAPSKNTYLFGYNNNGTAMLFSARPSSLFFISENITQAENTAIYNIIQNYQTILSRNI